MRETAKDVATNARTSGRAVVVLMERPASVGWADTKMIEAASTVVRELAPDDLAAVVYTWGGQSSRGSRRITAGSSNHSIARGHRRFP